MEQEQTRFVLSDEGWHQLMVALEKPPHINSRLLKLLLVAPIFKSRTDLSPGGAHDGGQEPCPE